MKPRVTSFAPQFLVDDLERSIAYYRKLGFTFGEPWDGFYAIGHLDGLELHLKEAPKNQAERRTGATTSISTPRPAWTASKRSTSSASPTARRSSSRSRRPRGARRTSTLRIPTATSSASAAVQRQADRVMDLTASTYVCRKPCVAVTISTLIGGRWWPVATSSPTLLGAFVTVRRVTRALRNRTEKSACGSPGRCIPRSPCVRRSRSPSRR